METQTKTNTCTFTKKDKKTGIEVPCAKEFSTTEQLDSHIKSIHWKAEDKLKGGNKHGRA